MGSKDRELAALVDSANANFEAIAAQDGNLREALRLFPGALEETRTTLADLGSLGGRPRPGAAASCAPAPARSRRRCAPHARSCAPPRR